MCTSLTGLEMSCGGEEGMGMSSAAAEVPNGGLSMRYIVCKSFLLCVPRVSYHIQCQMFVQWVGGLGLYQHSSMADHMTTLSTTV